MTADQHHGAEVDPATGYETTGHDWNGIRELNTPFPRIVIWALALTFLYSVIAWILLPAWPIGRDFTRGVLGLDQRQVAMQGYVALERGRHDWMAPFSAGNLDALAADPALMARAMPAAQRLFADNCAACHGTHGTGGPGFPDLTDVNWLWGGSPDTIAETLRVAVGHDVHGLDGTIYGLLLVLFIIYMPQGVSGFVPATWRRGRADAPPTPARRAPAR